VNDLSGRTSKYIDGGSFLSKGENKIQDIFMQANKGDEGIVSIHARPRRKKRVCCQHQVPDSFAW